MLKKTTLDNNITFIGEENAFVRTVSIGIWIKNGSVDETEKNNGMSHFIEHMLFKGTPTKGTKELANMMSLLGGRVNAFTGKEYVCYHAHVLDNHFDEALDLLSDMICNPAFREEDIEKEKGVIIEEIKMSLDSPEDITNDSLQFQVFGHSPLAYNILGTEENVQSFTRDDLIAYMNEHYIAENMVISVVGKINYDEVRKKLNEKFESINSGQGIRRKKNIQYHQAFIANNKDIEQAHVLLSFPSAKYDSQELYELSMMNSIIGGGMNSRLFQRVREKEGLAYSVYSYHETYDEIGLFNIYVAANPNQIEQVLTVIFEELNLLCQHGVSDNELVMTKEQLKSNLIISLESMNARMGNYGKNQLLLNRIKSQDEIINKLNAIYKESLNNIINKYINYKQMSVSLVGDLKKINVERIKELCQN